MLEIIDRTRQPKGLLFAETEAEPAETNQL